MKDFNSHMPGIIDEIREWFRIIKTFDGKPENKYAYEGKVLDLDKTLEVIHEN